jgi:hypothetical protein
VGGGLSCEVGPAKSATNIYFRRFRLSRNASGNDDREKVSEGQVPFVVASTVSVTDSWTHGLIPGLFTQSLIQGSSNDFQSGLLPSCFNQPAILTHVILAVITTAGSAVWPVAKLGPT